MPSLNHHSGVAAKFLQTLSTIPTLNFTQRLDALKRGHGVASAICEAIGVSLDDVAAASSPPDAGCGSLNELPEAFFAALARTIASEGRTKTRNEVRSRSTHGVRLVRIIAHILRHDDASLFVQIARVTVRGVPSAGLQVPPSLDNAGGLDRSATPLKARFPPSDEATFRALLGTSGETGSDSCLPHDFGLDLPRLEGLFTAVLGPVKRRRNVKPLFVPYAPVFVNCDPVEWTAYAASVDEGAQVDTDGATTESTFPSTAWDMCTLDRYKFVQNDYDSVVEILKRKSKEHMITLSEDPTSVYSYGVLREIDIAVKSGRSVIVTGISGTGKSSLIAQLTEDVKNVFEIGVGSSGPNGTTRVYRLSEVDRLLRAAKQTKGRKLLVVHEFMITTGLLCRFAVFDQFIFVGDERQPGPTTDASHLHAFVKAIGGKGFALSVIWRAANPCSLLAANFLGYGSRHVICSRRRKVGAFEQFAVLKCDDAPSAIAACMLAYAVRQTESGRQVTVAASDPEITRHIGALVAASHERPAIDFRSLDDLQGRESDVLVLDLHDVATHVRTVREALRYVLMLLGRARITTCWLVGRRNAARDPAGALSIEVIMAVLFRQRVYLPSYIKGQGEAFEKMQLVCRLMWIDEETIAAVYHDAGVAVALLIKDRRSHNAVMMERTQTLIEAPEFFGGTAELDRQYELLGGLIRSDLYMPVGVHTWEDVERHVRARPKSDRPSTFIT